MGFGSVFLCKFLNYGIGLWSGGTLVKDGIHNPNTGNPMTTQDVITTFFSILYGFFSLAMIGPSIDKVQKARESAYNIFEVLDAKPTILENDPQG